MIENATGHSYHNIQTGQKVNVIEYLDQNGYTIEVTTEIISPDKILTIIYDSASSNAIAQADKYLFVYEDCPCPEDIYEELRADLEKIDIKWSR